jgi:flagellar protein FlgJ
VAVVDTLEYRQGIARQEKAKFRVYDSLQAGLQDYVDFIRQQPRYQDAVAVSHDTANYFQQLQAAGYATDPNYAQKILQVMNGSVLKEVRNLLKNSGQTEL